MENEDGQDGQAVLMHRRPRRGPSPQSGFVGFRFPPDVIMVAVRWYLRYGLSYRDVEELLTERDITVDPVTIYCWVQRFMPLLAEAARPCRHRVGDRWWVDETYVKVSGQWRYVYRAIDQGRPGHRRLPLTTAGHRSGTLLLYPGAAYDQGHPGEVITDKAAIYPRVLDEVAPGVWHHTERYVNNRIEAIMDS